MPKPPDNRWEGFARENAEYYVLTGIGRSADAAALEQFFESGREAVEAMLRDVADLLPGHELALEFGCGVGRLLIPMARHFDRLIGVDIAPTMIEKLNAYCRRFGVQNVTGILADEPWERSCGAGLIYSWLVFQHIEDMGIIEDSLRRLTAALRPGGVALLQFDTRARSPVYRVRNTLPDVLLPRPWRRGIRRIRRSSDDLAKILTDAGFERVREEGKGTEQHVFIVRKPP
ncbi:MAG: class I SAM-dependent methyltransferase [Planctomycetota bacterium]|jgi:SAM-dependent methyltransferase